MANPKHEDMDDIMDDLTTVFPRLDDEDGFTVMPRFKRLGIGAFWNGHPVPEKQDNETEKKE